MSRSGGGIILVLAVVVVAAAIVAGLIVVGTPGKERMRRLDDRRVQDLDGIHNAVNRYWSKHEKLPSSLDQLLASPETSVQTRDPLTAQPYGYAVMGIKTYELCADFQRESIDTKSNPFWAHTAGRRCFRIEADADRR
jgi:hypothetical protein